MRGDMEDPCVTHFMLPGEVLNMADPLLWTKRAGPLKLKSPAL